MEQSNIRTVRFIGKQSAEDLYRCVETGRVFIRQRCDKENVRWLTGHKWSGGYEADCSVKAGLKIVVIDSTGRMLFAEDVIRDESYGGNVARKVGRFWDEELKKIAADTASQANLKSWDYWKLMMVRSAKKYKFTGYSDNWCYDAIYLEPNLLFTFECLGKKCCCTVQEATHKVSGQSWKCVELRDESKITVLAICGYIMEEEV